MRELMMQGNRDWSPSFGRRAEASIITTADMGKAERPPRRSRVRADLLDTRPDFPAQRFT